MNSAHDRFACPCCGFLTRPREVPGSFAICPVCRWEDDNLQFADPTYASGANRISLNEAKENYAACGAKSRDAVSHARPPLPSERPE